MAGRTLTPKLTLEEQRKRWASDFDAADRGITAMLHRRQVFRTIRDVLSSSTVTRHPILDNYLIDTYVAAVALAVRRESDQDTRTTSLARCLRQLLDSPNLINRDTFVNAYLASFPDVEPEVASDSFTSFASNGDTIEVGILTASLEELYNAASEVNQFANSTIAHRERVGDTVVPTLTFQRVDFAVNTVASVAQRFWTLAHPGTVRGQMTPITDLNFLTMFEERWMPEGFLLTLRDDDLV